VEKHFSSPTSYLPTKLNIASSNQFRWFSVPLALSSRFSSKKFEQIITMGCATSKDDINVESRLDDSVHVAFKRDAKRDAKKGTAPKCYVPRAPHPLLEAKLDDTTMKTIESDSEVCEVNPEGERIHAKSPRVK
jgi:hypothetical protein